MDNLSREDVLKLISHASIMDNLGMIIGSGFTRALTENQSIDWTGLLKHLCNMTNIKYEELDGSKPEIASQICKINSQNENCTYKESVNKIKNYTVSIINNIQPSMNMIKEYTQIFNRFKTSWIVTTNYDLNLETILSGKSISIGPRDCFFKLKNITPIYHIHGMINDPENIVLTNEDYVSIFRPGDYRQTRLPFLIKESTVLMLGYSLNDINIISSLDLANNVYKNINNNSEANIIQVIRKDNPESEPYLNDKGVIIIETDELINFFDELNFIHDNKNNNIEIKKTEVMDKIKFFQSATEKEYNNFIINKKYREEIISFVASLNFEYQYIYPSYINFLEKIDEKLFERSRPNGAFYAYNEKLKVILDILRNVNLNKTPCIFVRFIFSKLESVAPYIGRNLGQSYDAAATWGTEAQSLPEDILQELKKYIGPSWYNVYLRELLEKLNTTNTTQVIQV